MKRDFRYSYLQVCDHQFEEELNNRLALAEKEKESAVELAKANSKSEYYRSRKQ